MKQQESSTNLSLQRQWRALCFGERRTAIQFGKARCASATIEFSTRTTPLVSVISSSRNLPLKHESKGRIDIPDPSILCLKYEPMTHLIQCRGLITIVVGNRIQLPHKRYRSLENQEEENRSSSLISAANYRITHARFNRSHLSIINLLSLLQFTKSRMHFPSEEEKAFRHLSHFKMPNSITLPDSI